MFNLWDIRRKKQEIKEEYARKEQKRIRKNQLAVRRYHKRIEETQEQERRNEDLKRLAEYIVEVNAEKTRTHTEKAEKKINYL